jgi:hypothetical protein
MGPRRRSRRSKKKLSNEAIIGIVMLVIAIIVIVVVIATAFTPDDCERCGYTITGSDEIKGECKALYDPLFAINSYLKPKDYCEAQYDVYKCFCENGCNCAADSVFEREVSPLACSIVGTKAEYCKDIENVNLNKSMNIKDVQAKLKKFK